MKEERRKIMSEDFIARRAITDYDLQLVAASTYTFAWDEIR